MLEALRAALVSAINSGQSQNAISSATGVPQSTISTFISGKGGISGKVFDRLATFLGGRLTFPGEPPAVREPRQLFGNSEQLRRRVAELEAEVEKERALREQAERFFGALAAGRVTAPASDEKRMPMTPPPDTRCSSD